MALKITYNNVEFGVGDRVSVLTKFNEGQRQRSQAFEGMVIKIRGKGENKSFTVRRIGVQKVGIERIFPLKSPMIEKIKVIRAGTAGVRRSKLYYVRKKSGREIEKIYTRASRRKKAKS